MTRRGWLLFGILGVIWGVPYLLIKIAVRDLDPAVVAFGRTFLGALLLLPIALRRRALGPVLRRWRWLLFYTLVEIVGPWWLLGHAETRLNSSTASLLIAIVPLLAAVLTAAVNRRRPEAERLGVRRLAGLGLGLVGVAVLVGLDVHLDDLPSVGAAVLTAVGYAVGPLLISRKLADLPPMGVITGSLALAAVIFFPFAVLLRPVHVGAGPVWSVVALAVFCTATAFVVLFALIAEVGPARATVITYVNPAVAILLGVVLLGESFTVGMAIGFPLVILGSVLATSRRSRPTGRETVLAPAAGAGPAVSEDA
jgi:drug/metabolite transporter (DMT)-like permease